MNGEGDLGFNFGSDGTATVTGAGSSWTTNGFFYVGNNGDGTLNVDGRRQRQLARRLRLHLMGVRLDGRANIDGAGSTWTNANGLYIGFGGTGFLTITDGGSMQNGTFANVGFSPARSAC